jgi:hypothetical protein
MVSLMPQSKSIEKKALQRFGKALEVGLSYKMVQLCKFGFFGFNAHIKARVFRSSPQFAFTLGAYELLQRLLWVDFGGRY